MLNFISLWLIQVLKVITRRWECVLFVDLNELVWGKGTIFNEQNSYWKQDKHRHHNIILQFNFCNLLVTSKPEASQNIVLNMWRCVSPAVVFDLLSLCFSRLADYRSPVRSSAHSSSTFTHSFAVCIKFFMLSCPCSINIEFSLD